MSTNASSYVAKDEPISTYVPLPFAQLMKAGEGKQKEFDDTEEKTYKLDLLMNQIKAAPFDEGNKQEVHDKYQKQLESIGTKLQTGDVSGAKTDLTRTQNALVNDPEISTLTNNYKLYNEGYLKDVADLHKDSSYHPSNDVLPAFIQQKKASGNKLIPFNYTGMEKFTNPYESGSLIMKEIQKQLIDQGAISYDPKLGTIIINQATKGLTDAYITNVAKQNVPVFLREKGGMSFAKDYLYRGNDPAKLYEATQEYLREVGYKQAGIDMGSFSVNNASDYANDKQGQNAADVYQFAGPTVNVEQASGLTSKDLVDNKEEFSVDQQAGLAANIPGTAFIGNKSKSLEDIAKVGIYNRLDANKQKQFDNIATNLGKDYENILTKIKNNTSTQEENTKIYKSVGRVLDEINTGGTKVTPSFSNEGRSLKQLQELTTSYFGSDDLNKINPARLASSMVLDVNSGESVNGSKFYEDVIKPLQATKNPDLKILMTGFSNGMNPYVKLTGDKGYARSGAFNIGQNQYVISNVGNPIEQDVAKQDNDVHNLRYNPLSLFLPKDHELGKIANVTFDPTAKTGKKDAQGNDILGEYIVDSKLIPDGKTGFDNAHDARALLQQLWSTSKTTPATGKK